MREGVLRYFVPAVGHLPFFFFQKILIPRDRPKGVWALLKLTDA